MRVAFHGWPGNDETIDTVMFDPNQKPDTARAENSIFGSPEADNLLPKDEFPNYAVFCLDKLDNKLKMALTMIKTDNIILQ